MIRFHLCPDTHPARDTVVATTPGIEVRAFTYPTGVAALRLVSDRVDAVVLPYQGQQVWRLAVDGTDLTMHTMWDAPEPTDSFGASYGPFLMHCGLTGMGQVGPDDTHPPHGELPCARYRDAFVTVDPEGAVGIGGTYEHRRSHSVGYRFTPVVRVRPGDTGLGVTASIENLRSTPLPWQYLAHVNWAYWPGATLAPSLSDGVGAVSLHPDAGQDEQTRALNDRLAADPGAGDVVPEQPVIPEHVSVITPRASGGWAEFSMSHPDRGRATVGFETEHLTHAVRWISNTPDEQAAGFAMPATGHHLGRARSDRDGLTHTLAGGASATLRINVNYHATQERNDHA